MNQLKKKIGTIALVLAIVLPTLVFADQSSISARLQTLLSPIVMVK